MAKAVGELLLVMLDESEAAHQTRGQRDIARVYRRGRYLGLYTSFFCFFGGDLINVVLHNTKSPHYKKKCLNLPNDSNRVATSLAFFRDVLVTRHLFCH